MSTTGRLSIDAVRSVAVRYLRDVVACLSVSWLSIAPLYAFDLRPLPEPAVAATAATIVAVLLAALPLSGRTDWLLPDVPARAAINPPQGFAVRPEQYERSQAPSPAHGSSPGYSPRPAATPSPSRRLVDPSDFARRSETEQQCPWCGGFALTADGPSGQGVYCLTCNAAWSAPTTPTFVVVRSWLHH